MIKAPENKSLRLVPRRSGKKRTKKEKYNIMSETKPETQSGTPVTNVPPPKGTDNTNRAQHLADKYARRLARGPAPQRQEGE